MAAAYYGNSEVVGLLLEGGAKRELKSKHGKTALDIATEENKAEVVSILREHERLELVVRPAVVATLSSFLPGDLAGYAGDFVFLPLR